MDRKRLNRRVDAAVGRVARKLFPQVLCRVGGAAVRLDAVLNVEPGAFVRGSEVGARGSLVLSEDSFLKLARFFHAESDSALENVVVGASFEVSGVLWNVDVVAAPVVVRDSAGVATIALWRALAVR